MHACTDGQLPLLELLNSLSLQSTNDFACRIVFLRTCPQAWRSRIWIVKPDGDLGLDKLLDEEAIMCIRKAILPSKRVILAALFSLAMHVVGALLSFECHFNLCGLPRPGISMIEASFRGIFYALDVLSFVGFYVLSSWFFTFILFSFLSMLLFSISLKKERERENS